MGDFETFFATSLCTVLATVLLTVSTTKWEGFLSLNQGRNQSPPYGKLVYGFASEKNKKEAKKNKGV